MSKSNVYSFVCFLASHKLKLHAAENIPVPDEDDDDLEEGESGEEVYTQENINVRGYSYRVFNENSPGRKHSTCPIAQ